MRSLPERAPVGTVREDYSDSGDAWNYFTHDQARSRAYSWGEDGIAGISDERQTLCFSLALWNAKDPILKERMFGLAASVGRRNTCVQLSCRSQGHRRDNVNDYDRRKMLERYAVVDDAVGQDTGNGDRERK